MVVPSNLFQVYGLPNSETLVSKLFQSFPVVNNSSKTCEAWRQHKFQPYSNTPVCNYQVLLKIWISWFRCVGSGSDLKVDNNNLLHLYSAFQGTQSDLHRRGNLHIQISRNRFGHPCSLIGQKCVYTHRCKMSDQYIWLVFSIEKVHFKCLYLWKVQCLGVKNHLMWTKCLKTVIYMSWGL